MSTNNNSDKDIFDNLKKKFYRSGYTDKYGGSIFSCLVIIITIVLLTIYFQIKKTSTEIRADWANQRCSPKILPFAGMINTPPGGSAFEYTAENFTFCINGIVEDTASIATAPITFAISMFTKFIEMLSQVLQVIRQHINKIRNYLFSIIAKIFQKILEVIIPLQKTFIDLIDLFGKMNGIFQTVLGQAEGSYNIMASSIGAMHEFIVVILLIIAAIVIVLWIIPVTWGAAISMTIIFIIIMIPLIVISVYMRIIFNLQGSGIPGVPSCFDENTLLKTKEGKYIKIKEIEVGTCLHDNSKVTSKMKMSSRGHTMYMLDDIIVSGDHNLILSDKLLKVRNYHAAEKIHYTKPYIYCINTTSKQIVFDNFMFTDYDDLSCDEVNEIKQMLNKEELKSKDFHKKLEGGVDGETLIKLRNKRDRKIKDVEIYDKLINGETVLGLIEIDASNIDKFTYYLHNLEIVGGNNLTFYHNNLGIKSSIIHDLLKEKINTKIDKLYSVVTDKGYFSVNKYKFYDYNGAIDLFLKKEHKNIIKNIIR